MTRTLEMSSRTGTGLLLLRAGKVELVYIPIADRPVADLLIDLVRGGVGEVREEEDGAPSAVQQHLAQRGGAGAGVAAATPLGRREDRADAHAMRRGTVVASERDGHAALLPEIDTAQGGIGGEGAVGPFTSGLRPVVFTHRLAAESGHPARQEITGVGGNRAHRARPPQPGDPRIQLVDA